MSDDLQSCALAIDEWCQDPTVRKRIECEIQNWAMRRFENQELLSSREESRTAYFVEHRRAGSPPGHMLADQVVCDNLWGVVALPQKFGKIQELLNPKHAGDESATFTQQIQAGAVRHAIDGWSTDQILQDLDRQTRNLRDQTAVTNQILTVVRGLGELPALYSEWKKSLPVDRPELFANQRATELQCNKGQIKVVAEFHCVLPEELSSCHDPGEGPDILPLSERELSLNEKYVLLAAIHDAVPLGLKPLAPWQSRLLTLQDDRSAFHGRMWFDHLIEDVGKHGVPSASVFLRDLSLLDLAMQKELAEPMLVAPETELNSSKRKCLEALWPNATTVRRRMASKRVASVLHQSISVESVRKAMGQLIGDGYVNSKSGQGGGYWLTQAGMEECNKLFGSTGGNCYPKAVTVRSQFGHT